MTQTDPLLDEDGRCRKSDLFPRECGCASHRGGQTIEEIAEAEFKVRRPEEFNLGTDLELVNVYVAHQMKSKYDDGHCAKCGDRIRMDSWIYLLKYEETNEEIGWVGQCCHMESSL